MFEIVDALVVTYLVGSALFAGWYYTRDFPWDVDYPIPVKLIGAVLLSVTWPLWAVGYLSAYLADPPGGEQ